MRPALRPPQAARVLEVVTRRQALASGCSAAEVDARVRSGQWLALRRSVYLLAPTLPEDAALRHAVLVRAASVASSEVCVGSHESAAVVHRLPLLVPYDGPPVLSRDRPVRTTRSAARLCAPLASQLPAEHRTTVLGAPVTTLARTAVDLARVRLPLTAAVVLDAALATGTSREELLAVLDVQRGWPGSAQARERVQFADGRAESPLESVGRLRFAQLELPAPELQAVLRGPNGFLGRVDFSWERYRTVGEADGRVKYDGEQLDAGASLFDEKLREDRLRDAGYEVFRFGWEEAVRRPEVLYQRATRAFARAATRR